MIIHLPSDHDLQAGDKPVLIPGDPERANMADCDKRGGIPYRPSLIQFAVSVACSDV